MDFRGKPGSISWAAETGVASVGARMGITMLSHAKWKNNTPNRGIEYQGDIVCFFP